MLPNVAENVYISKDEKQNDKRQKKMIKTIYFTSSSKIYFDASYPGTGGVSNGMGLYNGGMLDREESIFNASLLK